MFKKYIVGIKKFYNFILLLFEYKEDKEGNKFY